MIQKHPHMAGVLFLSEDRKRIVLTMEVFRNEILLACQPGKKDLNVEVILILKSQIQK